MSTSSSTPSNSPSNPSAKAIAPLQNTTNATI